MCRAWGRGSPANDLCGLLAWSPLASRSIPSRSRLLWLQRQEGGRGPAIIFNNTWNKLSVESWVFGAAPELGHLLLHGDPYDVGKVPGNGEEEDDGADAFSSHLLQPDLVFCLLNRIYG